MFTSCRTLHSSYFFLFSFMKDRHLTRSLRFASGHLDILTRTYQTTTKTTSVDYHPLDDFENIFIQLANPQIHSDFWDWPVATNSRCFPTWQNGCYQEMSEKWQSCSSKFKLRPLKIPSAESYRLYWNVDRSIETMVWLFQQTDRFFQTFIIGEPVRFMWFFWG